ncbi:MAG TPA: 16S rRNA (guanine(966)-N(2))-methyltransferase RsmD [Pyrinomonadaceae bacterium]|nr:16S rRNA (guanine(966)-N(2))-methyltransferase RsmD [Pyrinomonadaceae bacterium]
MRVISGKYRGRQLKGPPSAQTRPTSDRLRETLFNVLAPRIEGARFLDLCAGTGAVGIEALSRGAEHVTFVDKSRKMCGLIEANLDALKIESENVDVVGADATACLKKFAKQIKPSLTAGLMPRLPGPFDIIFFDPPYAGDYEAVLSFVSEYRAPLLSDEGIVVVEHYKKKELPAEFGSLKCYRTLKQGDSVLSFFKRIE